VHFHLIKPSGLGHSQRTPDVGKKTAHLNGANDFLPQTTTAGKQPSLKVSANRLDHIHNLVITHARSIRPPTCTNDRRHRIFKHCQTNAQSSAKRDLEVTCQVNEPARAFDRSIFLLEVRLAGTGI